VVVALACVWILDRRHLAAELAAMRRAAQLSAQEPRLAMGIPMPEEELPNRAPDVADFIKALRETKDWYEFADRTADPFSKTTIADEAVPGLLELLNDPDPEVRTRAACTLGKIRRHPGQVVPALIPVLNDEVPNVRWHAAFALSQFGQDAKLAIPAFQKQIADRGSPIAAFCADTIQKIEPAVDIEASLIELLRNDLSENRKRAVAALGRLKSSRARPALIDAFAKEPNAEVKDQMARVIALIEAKPN
jgi:HEAT repeat protein